MRLALPTIQKGAAPRLATPDPRLPVQEAKARVAMFQAIGVPLAEMGQRYSEREQKREMQAAVLYAHQQDAAFVAARGGVEEFSVMDIEDDTFMDLADEMGYTDVDVPIPSHRIYAEWRKRNYQNALEEASAKISNKFDRESFMKQHQIKGQTNYAEDAVRASKAQIKYSARKTMEQVDQSILRKDFGGARLAVETSDLSEEAKSRAGKLIDTREQTDYFNEVIEGRDVDVMTHALTQLKENDPSTTSMIDAEQQKIFANQLRTAINTERTAINSASDSQRKIQANDLKSQIDDTWGNKPVDITEMTTNIKSLRASNPVLAREAEWTLKHQPVVSGILMAPPSIQMETLNGLKKRSTGSRETSYLIGQLEKSIEQGQIARRSDTLKWGKDTGFVVFDPIDYSSASSAQQSLAARVKPVLSMQRRYGSFTGFLTKDELIEFGSRLENAPNKLEYFASINKALGEYAEPFYEQLKQFNIGETAPLAGQIMSWGEGYRPVAENILKGANLRKTDNLTQLNMKERNSELNAFAATAFQGMFTGNKKQQSLMIEGFKDLYAVTGDKQGSFDQITGGSLTFNGYTVQAPVPGMSGWAYKSHLKNIRPEYWATPEMRAYGYTPEQLRKSLLNGDLKQEGAGRGISYLVDLNGSRVKKPDGVTDYQFKFDINAPTSSALLESWKAEQKAERDEAARLAKQEKATEVSTNLEYLMRGLSD